MPKRSVKTISLLVDNEFGVLTRIAALMRREGLNIKSLAVAETKNPERSRLVIAVECIDTAFERVTARLRKLDCIKGGVTEETSFNLSEELGGLFLRLGLLGEDIAHE